MKEIIIYSYLNCSTCRKALQWLDLHEFGYDLKDIVQQPPSVKYLNLALKQYYEDKKRIFNTRGKSFKLLNFDIYNSSNEEIIKVLLSDGKLIKRPFLVYKEAQIIIGFKEADYKSQLIRNGNF